jgi:hypothetical protein
MNLCFKFSFFKVLQRVALLFVNLLKMSLEVIQILLLTAPQGIQYGLAHGQRKPNNPLRKQCFFFFKCCKHPLRNYLKRCRYSTKLNNKFSEVSGYPLIICYMVLGLSHEIELGCMWYWRIKPNLVMNVRYFLTVS